MSRTLTQRDAQQLIDEIRNVKVSAHAIAQRINGSAHVIDAAFLGGLETVLQDFLRKHGCRDAAAALPDAMNRAPTDADVAVKQAQISSRSRKADEVWP